MSKSDRIESLIQWSKSRRGSKTNSDFIENLLFLRSSGLGTPSGMDDINDAIKLLLKKDVIKKNPVKPRKGEKTKAFVSRCMSEEKMSFPKQKQRIAVCLSKARKNPLLESGATISRNSGINRRAASMT